MSNAAQRLDAAIQQVEYTSIELLCASFRLQNDSCTNDMKWLLIRARKYADAVRRLSRVSKERK